MISATAALRAGRACLQAAEAAVAAAVLAVVAAAEVAVVVAAAVAVVVAVAAVVAGGSHENIPVINTSTLKGEENDASRNEQ